MSEIKNGLIAAARGAFTFLRVYKFIYLNKWFHVLLLSTQGCYWVFLYGIIRHKLYYVAAIAVAAAVFKVRKKNRVNRRKLD